MAAILSRPQCVDNGTRKDGQGFSECENIDVQ